MRAHQVDENGLILNTIVVESLDFMEGLKDADLFGGGPGDSIIDDVLIPRIPEDVEPIQMQLDLLIVGELILAKGPFKFAVDAIYTDTAVYPFNIIQGYSIVTITATDNLDISLYKYTEAGIVLK